MRTVLILPYFGNFPNYFNLYLKTLSYNKSFNWLIITDCREEFEFPENVTIFYKSFAEIEQLFQNKFDFKISLESPFKLCDFRPAFGYVFEEYLRDFDYWGHCDPDILWGDLSKFIDYKKLAKYDKIFSLGHLSIYKNEFNNNRRFLKSIDNKEHYKVVFSKPYAFAYDERYSLSINTVFINNNYSIYEENFSADVDSYHTNFKLNIHDPIKRNYKLESDKKQIFTWEDGSLFRYYKLNKKIVKEEFAYIHLQKRPMEIKGGLKIKGNILIMPNQFKPLTESITFENFSKFYKYFIFNKQYFIVKYKSFLYKLKHKSHFYNLSNSKTN